MPVRRSRAAIVSLTALVMLLAPMSLGVPYLGSIDAYAASKAGNHGKSGTKGKSSTNSKSAKSTTNTGASGGNGNGKLHAKLAGLNSLNRNINGMMNSSDPRMVDIRAFIEASAALAAAQTALATAQTTLGVAQSSYDSLVNSFGLTPYAGDPTGYAYTDTSLTALQQRLTDLNAVVLADPSNLAAAAEIEALTLAIGTISTSSELAALQAAATEVATQTAAVAAGLAATTDEMLIEALMVAANDNRVAQYGDGYVDPEMLEWAKQQLGVGDYEGLIDAYMAKL